LSELSSTSPTASVLVVDDDEDLRLLFQLGLKRAGFRISEAANGREALDAVRRDRPDLILLDLMMPVMDGWECLSALKADPGLRGIPVFIVTGKDQQQDQERAFASGAEAFIRKPFETAALVASIRERLALAP
jgi:CheY-like chemotaxis protein